MTESSSLSDNNRAGFISAVLLSLPIFANFFSRVTAEYFFDLLMIVVLFWTLKKSNGFNRQNLIIRSHFDFIWIAFLGVIVLGYIVNNTLGEPQIRDLAQFLWILGLYCYARLLKIAVFPKRSIESFSLFIGVLSIVLVIDFFKHPPVDPAVWGMPNRLQGTFTNTNFLAQSYYIIYIFLVSLLLSHLDVKRMRPTFWLAFAFLAMSCVLILTFNRSIWIASALVFPLLAFLWRKSAGAIVICIFCLLGGGLYFSNFGGFAKRVQLTLTPSKTGDVTRLNLWKTNFYIFKENPVLGVGYYNNARDIQSYYDKLGLKEGTLESHAHNEILSFLAGTGVIGTIIYISLFIYFAILSWRALKIAPRSAPLERGLLMGAFAVQPAFLLTGIADNNFEIHAARHFLVVSWAIILWLADYYDVIHNKNVALSQEASNR